MNDAKLILYYKIKVYEKEENMTYFRTDSEDYFKKYLRNILNDERFELIRTEITDKLELVVYLERKE